MPSRYQLVRTPGPRLLPFVDVHDESAVLCPSSPEMPEPHAPSGPPPSHEIVVVPAPGYVQRQPLLDQCISVRIDVFVHEQRFPLDVEVDDQDPTATHFLLRLRPCLTPIGTIRAHRVAQEDYYKLSRLAVLKPYRHYRFGRDLVHALHQWVRDDMKRTGALQPGRVVCHSQLPVKGFYSDHGYQPEGDEFDEDGAPHQRMVAHLSP